jgi:hypothetical protein
MKEFTIFQTSVIAYKNVKMRSTVLVFIIILTGCCVLSAARCPWPSTFTGLTSGCLCQINADQEVSVQCNAVDFERLVSALDTFLGKRPIDLLYVNNSTVAKLNGGTFRNLQVKNLQLSNCRIANVMPGAFSGIENSLKNLNLQGNLLQEIPIEAILPLRKLLLLDLSSNRLLNVPANAFEGLELQTLKLGDNRNVVLDSAALQGLETSLRNINLKGIRLTHLPDALSNMTSLAFLDLAQNNIAEVDTNVLETLQSLTALNLEGNRILQLNADIFVGVNRTLSSLSLLKNLIDVFPTEALSSLTRLRVSSAMCRIEIKYLIFIFHIHRRCLT